MLSNSISRKRFLSVQLEEKKHRIWAGFVPMSSKEFVYEKMFVRILADFFKNKKMRFLRTFKVYNDLHTGSGDKLKPKMCVLSHEVASCSGYPLDLNLFNSLSQLHNQTTQHSLLPPGASEADKARSVQRVQWGAVSVWPTVGLESIKDRNKHGWCELVSS